MKKLGLLLLMLMVSICIFAKGEVKTIVYTTNPVMHCEGCENKIKNQLKYEKGIKMVVTDVEKQTVTITYDASKTSPEKIEAAFGKINYKVKQVNPNATKTGCQGCAGGHGCAKEQGCGKHEGCAKAEGCGKQEGCKKAEGQCCKEKEQKASECCKK